MNTVEESIIALVESVIEEYDSYKELEDRLDDVENRCDNVVGTVEDHDKAIDINNNDIVALQDSIREIKKQLRLLQGEAQKPKLTLYDRWDNFWAKWFDSSTYS